MTSDEYTISEHMLEVGSGHTLYIQEWGNPRAKETVIFLHGGPGSGCSDKHKTLFEPARHRVIFFDQRGSGKSRPYGSLKDNDTDHLVTDISKIADLFKLKEFVLVGGSWGSCLALAYALRHPERVTRLVIRGILTGRQSEIDFLYKGGFRAYFPEVWEKFVKSAPLNYADDPFSYHLPRVLGSDPSAAKVSAYACCELQVSVLALDDRPRMGDFESFDPVETIIECHYMANQCFLPENYILDHAHKLDMPVSIVQGRYDTICAPVTAYELAQKLPNANLIWTQAGHWGHERANWEVVRALLLC